MTRDRVGQNEWWQHGPSNPWYFLWNSIFNLPKPILMPIKSQARQWILAQPVKGNGKIYVFLSKTSQESTYLEVEQEKQIR